MCFSNCFHQNRDGECRHSINGLHPCEEGYEDAKDRAEYERDCADDMRFEDMRERRYEEAHNGN